MLYSDIPKYCRTNKQKQMHNQNTLKFIKNTSTLYIVALSTYSNVSICRPGVTWRRPQGEMITVRQGENKRKSKKQAFIFFVKVIISNWRVRISNIDKIYALGIDYQFWLKMLTTNFEFWYWLSLFMQSDTASFLVVIEQNGRHTDQVALAHLKISFT